MFFSNRIVLVGLVFLALAMCGALLLVTTKLFGATTGTITAAALAVPSAVLWFLAPLLRGAEHEPRGFGGAENRAGRAAGESRAADECGAGSEPVREPGRPGGAAGSDSPGGLGGPEAPDARWWANDVRYDLSVSAQEHLRVDARSEQDRVVLHLTGELDLASSAIFERALEDPALAAAPLLVLDLDDLKFVDSTGLRIILLAHEGARARGQEFAITPGSPQVQRLLSITSVAEHMHVIAPPDDLRV